MQTSESLTALLPALLKVQDSLEPVAKSAHNSFFNSSYAPFDDVLAAALTACSKQGLFLTQSVEHTEQPSEQGVTIHTTVYHPASGEFMGNEFYCPLSSTITKDGTVHTPTAQTAGSAATYGKRYGLTALLGMRVGDVDDDGNEASKGNLGSTAKKVTERIPPPQKQGFKGPGSEGGIPKSCPKCGGKVYSNLEKKASGEYKPTSQDWTCADKTCKTGKWRTGGFLDKKDSLDEIPAVLQTEEVMPWDNDAPPPEEPLY